MFKKLLLVGILFMSLVGNLFAFSVEQVNAIFEESRIYYVEIYFKDYINNCNKILKIRDVYKVKLDGETIYFYAKGGQFFCVDIKSIKYIKVRRV